MQFEKFERPDRSRKPSEAVGRHRHGSGAHRGSVLQGKNSVFDNYDLFQTLIRGDRIQASLDQVGGAGGASNGASSHRVIADHLRSSSPS